MIRKRLCGIIWFIYAKKCMVFMIAKSDDCNDYELKIRLIERLPVLTDEQRSWAEKPDQKSWALGCLRYGAGYVWNMPDQGLSMQIYNEGTFRLLTVVEHDYCLLMASLVKATLDSVGLTLDMSQVVIRAYVPNDDNQEGGSALIRSEAPEVV